MKAGAVRKNKETEKVKKIKRKIHEIDSTNDKKYRGPLTYQHLRIAAWLLMALLQVCAIMTASTVVFPDGRYYPEDFCYAIKLLGDLALPFFLFANFAIILSERADYKKLLIKFGALAGGVVAAYFYVYERFILGLLSVFMTRSEAKNVIGELIAKRGFLAFNLFLDLFLCTLVLFFLNYTPKRLFVGRKIIVFRLLALVPILYEAVSVLLKILAGFGEITLSPAALPFLTTKPPMMFVVFIALALFIKQRERRFIRNGKTPEEYHAFLLTNTNSWHFSSFAAITMAIAAIIDVAIAIIIAVFLCAPFAGSETYELLLLGTLAEIDNCGIGASASLILAAPLMLLFSYNRPPRHPKLDILIPIAGVALIVIVYIEAGFFFITHVA